MKKWLIGTLVTLLLLFLAGTYIFIPENIRISRAVRFNSNQAGVFRFLSQRANWQTWWPGNEKDSILEYNGYKYNVNDVGYNILSITIDKKQQTDTSVIHVLPIGIDSIKIVWDATMHTGNNPFLRIGRYFKARELARNFESLLVAMRKYTGSIENIYGADIKRGIIKIEYLALVKDTFDRRPSDEVIYGIIARIRKYIANIHATEEDHPIFNITQVDSSRFELVAAVPVTSPVPDSGIFLSKKLLKNGNMLTAEITGGQGTVDNAIKQFDAFVQDHNYQNIALPYQSFLTDRLKNTDTSKWVTRIVYPIL